MANRIVHILAIGVLVMLAWAATTQAATNWYSGHHYIQEGGSYGDVYVRNNAIVDMTGGEVTRGLLSYDNSTVNVNGGEVWLVLGRGNSTVNFSGGQAYRLESEDNSTVNITGGRVKRVVSQDDGTVHMSGGQAYGQSYSSHRSTFNLSSGSLDLLYALDESTINFSGGQVNRLYASGSATINISGGRIKTNMFADGSSVINIYGYGFEYDGEVLTGYWHDHTSFSIRIVDNFSITYEHIVFHIRGEPRTLIGLEIVGPNDVAENFSASYKAVAYYDDDSTRDVTDSALWVVEPNMAANIDGNGVLRTKDIVTHQSATILAGYTEGDVTFEAEKAIDILAICPTGTALRFDGVDDYVYLGDIDEFEFGEDDFSISVWIYLGYHSGSGHIITKYYWGSEQRQWYLAHSASDAILFYTNPTGASSDGEKLASVSPVAQNAWAFITAVRKGSTKYIYINGELDTTGTTAGILTGQSAKVYIGVVDSPSEGLHHFFNGEIDDLRIYNRALDANDIQELMHKKLTGDEPNLVGYWDFDEGEGQIVYDLSGNGNDGQLGSTPEADSSDPAWIESDAPIGICSLYQIATMAAERALECKTALIEELLAALAEEWAAYEALEELLESGDYGDLDKGDIVTAKQKIHSAIQHEEQSIDALEKSIEKLEDALSALGYEPEPPVPNQPPNVNITNPQDGAVFGSYQTIEIEANAWDVDGSVVKVEFFADGSKIGEDNDGTDGWKNSWYDHPVDTYSLTAKATDNDGAATTSPAVEITVLEAPLPGQASNPNQANGATTVSISADLSWTAGFGAILHNVYFGTTSPGTFRGSQTAATFAPGSMPEYTTYYWRIDEVNPFGTTTGTVWSFTTGGGVWPPPI